MTLLVIVLLAVVWIAVLVPPYVRSFREGRPGDSISSFRKQLNTLERSAPTALPAYRRPSGSPSYAPPVRSTNPYGRPAVSARQRRRQVLIALVGAVIVTGIAALVAGGGPMLWANVVVDLLLVAYVMLLVQMQKAASMYSTPYRYHSAA